MPSKQEKKFQADLMKLHEAADSMLSAIVKRLLPDGKVHGRYWVSKSPHDGQNGSKIKIDLLTGGWLDYGSGTKGQGAVSLAVFVTNVTLEEIMVPLARMLRVKL